MPQYKLTYFDLRGLGEVVRLIFHYADVKFDDVRITQEKWPELKPSTIVLLFNGFHKRLVQAHHMGRFQYWRLTASKSHRHTRLLDSSPVDSVLLLGGYIG